MKAIVQYDLNGNVVKFYTSIVEAEKITKINRSSINNCCHCRQSTAGGFQWRYYVDKNSLNTIPPAKTRKKVTQYHIDGTPIRTFNSIAEAARITNIDDTCISRCCRNKAHTAGHYIWKFFNEDEVA